MLPYLTLAISVTVPFVVMIVGLWLNRKLHTIHVLVNSQMAAALKEIEDLKAEMHLLHEERAELAERLRLRAAATQEDIDRIAEQDQLEQIRNG